MRSVALNRRGIGLVSICAATVILAGDCCAARKPGSASNNRLLSVKTQKLVKGTPYESHFSSSLLQKLFKKAKQLPRHIRDDLLHGVYLQFFDEISNHHSQKTLSEALGLVDKDLGWMNGLVSAKVRDIDDTLLPQHRFLRSTLKDFPLETAQELTKITRMQADELGVGWGLALHWLDRFLRDHPHTHGDLDALREGLREKMRLYYDVMAAQ